MNDTEDKLNEKQSLQLITEMISKAKNSYYDTGVGAIMWGTIIAVCSLVKLSEMQFGHKLPFDIYLLTVVAVIPQIYITIREKRQRKVKTFDDAYMNYIWLGFGICIFLMIFVINAVFSSWQPVSAEYYQLTGRGSTFRFSEFVSSFFLLLYGLPTFITGTACRFKPMLWGSLLCWVSCIIAIFTPIKVDLLLLAVSAIVAWLIPGLIIEREYRMAKKRGAALNV